MSRSTASLPHPKLMSLAEWADLDEDVEGELVDGVLEEEEMPTYWHETIVVRLIVALHQWALRHGANVAGSETKIAVGPRRGRKPDITVHRAPRLPSAGEALVRATPHIVVEVTSPRPRDIRRDRIDKHSDYARAGIPYYWIVDPQLCSLEVFKLDRSRRYTVVLLAGEGRVRVPGCPGLVLDLDALWKEVEPSGPARKRPASDGGRRASK
jgi:Uma2 family endonuclease